MHLISPVTLRVRHHPYLMTMRQSSGRSQIVEHVQSFLLLFRSMFACNLSISLLRMICDYIFKVPISSWVMLTLLLSTKSYPLLIKMGGLFRNYILTWRICGVNWLLWRSLYVRHAPLVIVQWNSNVCSINNLYFSSWCNFVTSTRCFGGIFSIDNHCLL